MTNTSGHIFDDSAAEADALEQLTPTVDDDDASMGPDRVRLSPYAEADEADLIEQAIVVPLEDDLYIDR